MSEPLTIDVSPSSHSFQIGQVVTTNVVVHPKWWELWKRPRVELRTFVVTAVTSGGDSDVG